MDKRIGIILAMAVGAVLIIMAVTAWFALRTSNEILSEFHRVNSGLDSTRLTLHDQQTGTRAMFDSFVCAEMAGKADSLHRAYTDLKALIDAFKTGLVLCGRDNTLAADSVFEAHEQGTQLYRAFSDFFALADRTCTNDSIDQAIDRYASSVLHQTPVEEWRAANFTNVPAIASITILGKYQSDAVNAEALVMNDLLARCEPAKSRATPP